MPKRRKTLPADIQEIFKAGDLAKMQSVFDLCALDAVGGYDKRTALGFPECPDDMTRWLVAKGADLHAPNRRGEPPLHSRAVSFKDTLGVLLNLGADVHRGEGELTGTALHIAAKHGRSFSVRRLLNHGAHVNATNRFGDTPLHTGLASCDNNKIVDMADTVQMLLDAGATKTPAMAASVTRIGEGFEFHRANFNPDTVASVDAGLARLYDLFDVAPVAHRQMHDGATRIQASGGTWQERMAQLWDMLVPSSGAAQTVQGEVIRIASRIDREVAGNGRINWSADFTAMADAYMVHIKSGAALPPFKLDEAQALINQVKRGGAETEALCRFAVQWVDSNPDPIALPTPPYAR